METGKGRVSVVSTPSTLGEKGGIKTDQFSSSESQRDEHLIVVDAHMPAVLKVGSYTFSKRTMVLWSRTLEERDISRSYGGIETSRRGRKCKGSSENGRADD